MKKAVWSKFIVIILLIYCAWYGRNLDTWGRNQIIQNDVISYYAYLPATLIFNDLDFEFIQNLPESFEGEIWLQTAPSGRPVLRMTMGLAILWAPFFLIAHGAAHIIGVSTQGYSWPYSLSIFIAALFYFFWGLFFLRKLLLKYFSDFSTSVTLLIIVLATNLTYYVISEPGMSHVFSFALITAFLFFSVKWSEKTSWLSTLFLGILTGLIVLIRPVNVLVILFPAFIGISNVKDFVTRLKINWNKILFAGLVAFIVVLPQMLYWKSQTGYFLFNSYMDSGKFYFLKPQIMNGLFSFRKGWLIYTPVMFFAFFGLFLMRKWANDLFFPIILFLILNIYVVFSWWCWWYGGSFGARPMIESYGIMAIPLAAFVETVKNRKILQKGLVAFLILFFIGLNQFQMTQYRTSLLHWDSMTKKAYWEILFKKSWPEGYDKMIKIPDYEKALKGEKEYP